ncbi:MAG: hypothetical protein ACYC96_10545 [Fimbriimonadaceae bacterium]
MLATTALLLVAVTALAALPRPKIIFQVAGVCNPDPYGIKCFNPAGNVDLKLTAEIRNFFLKHPEHPLRLLYGRRDKLIVVRRRRGQSADPGTSHGFALSDGTPFPAEIDVPALPTDELATQLYWYYPPPAQKTISVTYQSTTALPPVTVPARVGATVSFGPYTMTIASIDRLRPAGRLSERPEWMIAYRLTGIAPNVTFTAQAELFGKDGKMIRAVDHAGAASADAADTPAQGIDLAVPLRGGWVTWADPAGVDNLVVRARVTVGLTFPTVALGPY